MNIFNTFKHLFSRSQAWRLVASPIKEYIKGYSYFPATIRDFIDNIWNDIFPSKTRELEKWEQQFNLSQSGTVQERIDNLSGRWSAQGGQGFDYLQDLIHNSGYPQVFLHEWWLPSDAYRVYCLAPDSDCGSGDAECGVVTGVSFVPVEYPIPQDPVQWRYIIYVGAEIFGDIAEVPAELQDEFERLLLGKLPYQQWIGPMINYV